MLLLLLLAATAHAQTPCSDFNTVTCATLKIHCTTNAIVPQRCPVTCGVSCSQPTPKPTPPTPPPVPKPAPSTTCEQGFADTCCQWGGNNQAAPGYTPMSCQLCMSAQMSSGVGTLMANGCGQAMLDYCDSLDWDHQMLGKVTLPTTTQCAAKGLSAPVSLTPGLINPVVPAPATCLGNKQSSCASPCVFSNKACLDTSGSCDQGSVAINNMPANTAKKICTKSLSGCQWSDALQSCSAAPIPAPTVPAPAGCSGLSKKKCKNASGCEYNKKTKACSTAPAAPAPGTACDKILSGKSDCLAAVDAAGASMGCEYKKKKCGAAPAPVPAGSCTGLAKKACKKAGCTYRAKTCSGGSSGTAPAPVSPAPASGACKLLTVKKDCTKAGCKWSNSKSTCK